MLHSSRWAITADLTLSQANFESNVVTISTDEFDSICAQLCQKRVPVTEGVYSCEGHNCDSVISGSAR